TLFLYLAAGAAATALGLFLVNVVQPGSVDGDPAVPRLALEQSTEDVAARIGDREAGDVANLFLRMIPQNVVQAAAEGQMLGIIFFALLFGYFVLRCDVQVPATLSRFWSGVFNVMRRMT